MASTPTEEPASDRPRGSRRRIGKDAATVDTGRGNETRDRILTVARQLFLEGGYYGTSTGAIAEQVGIRAPALYWHFASKEAILFAIIQETLTEFLEVIRIEADDPAVDLVELVRRYVLYQLERRDAAEGYSSLVEVAQLGHILTEEHRAELRTQQRTVHRIFKKSIERGVASGNLSVGDVSTTAFALLSMCEYVNTWARRDGRLGAQQIADEYARLAARMVGLQEFAE